MKRFAPWLLLLAALLFIVPGWAQQGNQTFLPLAALPGPTVTNSVPPTATQVPPTATQVPPTATQVPPTATAEVPPTETSVPPTATQEPTATQQPPTGANVVCTASGTTELCAWVSEGTPAQNSDVTVYGRLYSNGSPVAGQPMTTTWNYRTTAPSCDTGATGGDGIASCTRDIGRASIGFRVDINVTLGGLTATTFFTPQ